jgi:Flp pilus assembly protein TadD
LTGDEDGYRRVCQRMVARFGQTDDPVTARRLVWICSMGPQSGIDPARIAAWAQVAARSVRDKYTLVPLAHACYRAGQFDQAVTILHEAMDLPEPTPRSEAAFPLALAYRGLGQEEESRKWYRIGGAELQSATPRDPGDPVSWAPAHWLTVNVWYREAKAVFEPAEEPAPQIERVPTTAAPAEKKATDPPTNK